MEDTSIIKWCLFVLILSKNSDVLDTLERNHEECDYNYYFDEYNASCLECPFGSFGQNCMEQCISGFYGRLCGNACSCEAHKCNRVDGCPKVLTTSVLGSAGITLTSPQTSDTNQEMVKEFPLSWISTQGSEEYLSSQNKFTKSYSHSDTFTEKHFKGTTKHKRREGKTSVYSKKPMLPYQVTSTTKQPSNISNEEDHWMLTSVLLIILISGLVEPQFIYVHQTNETCVNIQRTNDDIQDTDTVDSERLGDYDEIRQSKFNQSNTCSTSIRSSPSVNIRKTNSAPGTDHLPTHSLYEKISFHIDYHVLQFRGKQDFASPDYLFEGSKSSGNREDEYVFLRSSRSLDFPTMTEDLKFHNDSPLLDKCKREEEKTVDQSNNLLRSFSEGKLESLKNAPTTRESNLTLTEEDCLLDEYLEETERPYSVVHIKKSRQENLFREFYPGEQR